MIPIYGMALTPMHPDGSLDLESLRRLAASLAADGCTALIGLGVIAEPDQLAEPERIAIVETLLGAGIPTYATVSAAGEDAGASEASRLSSEFRGALTGLMVPVTRPTAHGFRADLQAIADASDLPLIVQDYPQPTKVHIEVDELLAAIDLVPSVVAVKEEGMPTVGRIRALRDATGIGILTGLGGASLTQDLLAGADAVACGISRPDLVSDAIARWTPTDPGQTQRAMDPLTALITVETQPTTSIAFRKEHWRRRGVIAHNAVRPRTRPYAGWMSAHSSLAGYPVGAGSAHRG